MTQSVFFDSALASSAAGLYCFALHGLRPEVGLPFQFSLPGSALLR